MKPIASLAVSLSFLVAISAPVFAQDDDAGDDTSKDTNETSNETSNEAADPSPGAMAPEPAGTEPLTTAPIQSGDISYRLIGVLRLEAAFVQSDENQEFVGRTDGFRLQNARVGVEGKWRDRLTIRFSADGAIDERDNPNETEGTLRFGLVDAYADVALRKSAVLRLARFQAIFDIERLTSPSRRTFARRALSSRGVAATEGFETQGLAVKRNLGVALRSERLLESDGLKLGYELAIQNGNGATDAANDNDALAYSAAVFATVSDAIWVFGAGRYNRRNEGELPFRRTEDDVEAAAGLRLERAPFRATVQGLARRTRFPTTGGPVRNAFGAHAEALLTIPSLDWLEAGYRFSFLEPSDLMPADRVQEHTVGANIRWPAVRGVLQINATHAIEQAGRALDNSRLEAVVQVSL